MICLLAQMALRFPFENLSLNVFFFPPLAREAEHSLLQWVQKLNYISLNDHKNVVSDDAF